MLQALLPALGYLSCNGLEKIHKPHGAEYKNSAVTDPKFYFTGQPAVKNYRCGSCDYFCSFFKTLNIPRMF